MDTSFIRKIKVLTNVKMNKNRSLMDDINERTFHVFSSMSVESITQYTHSATHSPNNRGAKVQC